MLKLPGKIHFSRGERLERGDEGFDVDSLWDVNGDRAREKVCIELGLCGCRDGVRGDRGIQRGLLESVEPSTIDLASGIEHCHTALKLFDQPVRLPHRVLVDYGHEHSCRET
jgi:hypothetical protein